jgi:hypothetical protein
MNLRDSPIKKTRSAHRCLWCGDAIEIGQSAHCAAWVFDGDFQHGHFHPECWAALGRSEDAEDGWTGYEQPRGVALNEYGEPLPGETIPAQATA